MGLIRGPFHLVNLISLNSMGFELDGLNLMGSWLDGLNLRDIHDNLGMDTIPGAFKLRGVY